MIGKVIKEIENAFKRDELLNAFIPCPKELEELTNLKPNDELVKKMVAKYGAEDWYVWRLDHWGTKWDTGRSHGTLTIVRPTKLKLDVKTAWLRLRQYRSLIVGWISAVTSVLSSANRNGM